MTSEPTDKLRALFLTALMVFSVFALTVSFAGTAAAGNAPSQEEATELTPDSNDVFSAGVSGDSSVIVVTFNISVVSAKSGSGMQLNEAASNDNQRNITVYVDNRNVTAAYSIAQDGSSSGTIVLSSSSVNLNGTSELKVHFNNVSNAAQDGFTQPGNVSTTVTTATVDVPNNGENSADATDFTQQYEGTLIALNFEAATGDADVSTTDTEYEYWINGAFENHRATGINDRIATFDTEGVNRSADHEIRVDTSGDGSYDALETAVNITDIRQLSLSVTADSTDLTTNDDNIDAEIESAASGRSVEATLTYVNNKTTAAGPKSKTIGSDGTVDVSFSNPGEADYWINVTDVGTGATAVTDQITVSKVEGEAGFTSSVFTEDRGDIINITVTTSNVVQGEMYVGDGDIGYGQGVSFNDTNEDGEVKIQWNTYTGEFSVFNPEDRASSDEDTINVVNSNANLNTANTNIGANFPVDAGSYSLNVSIGTEETGVATVELTERSLDNLQTWVAAKGADTDTIANIQDNAVDQSSVAHGEKFILQLDASGFGGFLNSTYDWNETAWANTQGVNPNRLDRTQTAASKGLYLTLEQTNEGANQNPTVLNASNVSLVFDDDDNVHYLVVPTEDGAGFTPASAGDKYDAEVVLNETSPYVDADPDTAGTEKETLTTSFTVEERDASIDNLNASDELNVNPENVSISGTTTVAPGTNLTIRVRSTTAGQSYLLINEDITVQSDGTWSTEFDFSDRTGTHFDIFVRVGSETLQQRAGFVQAAPTASVTFNDQDAPQGAQVVVQSVTMSQGGFVAIHSGSAGGPVIGSSKFLSAGSHSNVRIALDEPISEDTTLVAMPHQDTDGDNVYEFPDADGPYTADGAAVTDSASVAYSEAGTVVVTQESPTPMIVTRTVQVQSPTPREVERTVVVTKTATPGQPGFGVAIAVVALLAAALLALRRRE